MATSGEDQVLVKLEAISSYQRNIDSDLQTMEKSLKNIKKELETLIANGGVMGSQKKSTQEAIKVVNKRAKGAQVRRNGLNNRLSKDVQEVTNELLSKLQKYEKAIDKIGQEYEEKGDL